MKRLCTHILILHLLLLAVNRYKLAICYLIIIFNSTDVNVFQNGKISIKKANLLLYPSKFKMTYITVIFFSGVKENEKKNLDGTKMFLYFLCILYCLTTIWTMKNSLGYIGT